MEQIRISKHSRLKPYTIQEHAQTEMCSYKTFMDYFKKRSHKQLSSCREIMERKGVKGLE